MMLMLTTSCLVLQKPQIKNDVFFIATHKEHVAQYFKLSNMCKLIPDILDVDSYV